MSDGVPSGLNNGSSLFDCFIVASRLPSSPLELSDLKFRRQLCTCSAADTKSSRQHVLGRLSSSSSYQNLREILRCTWLTTILRHSHFTSGTLWLPSTVLSLCCRMISAHPHIAVYSVLLQLEVLRCNGSFMETTCRMHRKCFHSFEKDR